MADKLICRIGIFYDGSYFAYPQRYFFHKRNLGWLSFKPLHSLIESYIRTKEQGYTNYRIVYASWTQGLFSSSEADERQLRNDRNLQHDLMHAGIEIKYLPISTSSREKGVDVALAIDALQIGLEGKIDVAVLVTGDADLVPLAQTLMKQGIRVMVVYFEYEDGEDKSFINERLLSVCNYSLNINSLEYDKDFKTGFKALFRRPDDFAVKNNGAKYSVKM
jgi:uncharacterized LabA/DUF88 family protein